MIGNVADHAAGLVGLAGLLDVERHVVDGGDHPNRLVLHPATVCVGGEFVAAFQHRRDLADALDIEIRASADLHLELVEALRLIGLQALGHGVRVAARDDFEQAHAVLHPATEKVADRLAGGLAKQIPAGDVERRLDVRVPLERAIHDEIDRTNLARVEADQAVGELHDPGAGALGVGRQIGRPQRADFAVARLSVVGGDFDDRAVEGRKTLVGPAVGAFLHRQRNGVEGNLGDLHGRGLLRERASGPSLRTKAPGTAIPFAPGAGGGQSQTLAATARVSALRYPLRASRAVLRASGPERRHRHRPPAHRAEPRARTGHGRSGRTCRSW